MDNIVDFCAIKKQSMQTNKEVADALEVVKNFCINQNQEDCNTGRCILFKWCKGTESRLEYPCNWRIPK